MQPDATINLTSLLDIVFNLLLVFMLLAPALKHGITVELARTGGGSSALNAEEPLTIVIAHDAENPDPRIYIDDERIMLDQLQNRLRARSDANPRLTVLIEPSRTVPTETTLQVLAAILGAGIENYGFVTEPDRGRAEPRS